MSVPPEQFARIASRIDLRRVGGQTVLIVGVGTVGSQIAVELARSGVGRLRLIDGDTLERPNIVRHALTDSYVGRNKAEAMTEFLADELGAVNSEAVPCMVDDTISGGQLDGLLYDADLIVSATDKEAVQRQVARRALALDIPAVLPALYRQVGGEVFVQISSAFPCYLCWAAHRHTGQPIRGVDALNVHAGGVVNLATTLCLGLLDENCEFHQLLQPQPGQQQPQLFVRNELGTALLPFRWREDCPACTVGPPSIAQVAPARSQVPLSTSSAPPGPPPPPEGIGHLFGGMAVLLFSVIYFASVKPALEPHPAVGKWDSEALGHGLAKLCLPVIGYAIVILGIFLVLRGFAKLTGRYQAR